MQELVELCYGKNANLYCDVLQVPQGATEQDIQSAFVTRRYELFNDLQNASISNAPNRILTSSTGAMVSLTERQYTEKKMDALIAVYRLLCNPEKRREYNLSLSAKKIQDRRKSNSNNGNSTQASPVSVDELGEKPSEASTEGGDAGAAIHASMTEELAAIQIDDSRDHGSPPLHLATSGPKPTPQNKTNKRGLKFSINPKKKLFGTPNSNSGTSPKIANFSAPKSGKSRNNSSNAANVTRGFNSDRRSLTLMEDDLKITASGSREGISLGSGSFVIDEATTGDSEDMTLSTRESSSRVGNINEGSPIVSASDAYVNKMHSSSEFISTPGSSDTSAQHAMARQLSSKSGESGISYTSEKTFGEDNIDDSIGYISPKSSSTITSASATASFSWSEADENADAEGKAHKETKSKTKKKPKRKTRGTHADDESVVIDDYRPGMLASWLRSRNFVSQADLLDDIGREIEGAKSDTALAFSQIWNAFTIDDEAIDSMALNINTATSDLAHGEYTR